MKMWCIHTKRLSDGGIVKVQMPGPDDGEHMFRIASNAVAERAPGYEVVMVHEEAPDPAVVLVLPYFPTAIENMIFQGLTLVNAMVFAARFIIHKQREADS